MPMTDTEVEAEYLLNQAEVAKASGDYGYKLLVGGQCRNFAEAHKGDLDAATLDQLNAALDYQELGTQAGTAAKPNAFTTAAATKQDPMKAALNGRKILSDITDSIGAFARELGAGATKGLGSTALKLLFAGAGLFALYAFAKHRKWL